MEVPKDHITNFHLPEKKTLNGTREKAKISQLEAAMSFFFFF
jgi:hypothetical protein